LYINSTITEHTVIDHAAAQTCNFSSKKTKIKMEIRQELTSISLFRCPNQHGSAALFCKQIRWRPRTEIRF
jgi:hypothetical protein